MELTRKHSYHGRFNPKDDFEFDFNDISRASTPMSSMSSRSEGRRREKTGHSIEDYKRKIARLKSELEMERAHSKQVHKEKSAEIKLLRNSFKRERQQIIDETKEKYQEEKSKEVEILQENIVKKKDLELQQVLRYKEEELKNMKEQFEKEKENLIKSVDENEKRDETAMKNLEEEIKRLKDEKLKIEDKFKKKCDEQTQKEKEFSRIKNDYDTELRRILSESKKVAMGNLQKLKKAEKDLSEACLSDDEISLSDFLPQYLDPHSQSSSRATSRAHSRAPSRSLAHLEDFKLEDIDIEKFLASATPSPFVPLNSTYVLEDNSTSASIPSRSPHLVSRAQSVNEVDHDDPSSELRKIYRKKSVNRRLSEEKDRQLQKKVSELQAQTQRLERKVSLLKAENETLKRKQDEHKPLEDKIKTLKKRNAELAAIARRLEEKAKHLQQENMKKQKDDTGHQEADHLKKVFARQRAKDLAEHAKAMLTKDREIEELRKKCQELADQLSNADFLGPENAQMYGEKEELVSIIKQAAKERLQLEKQLAKVKPTASIQAEIKRLKELEATNATLEKEIAKLEKAKEDTERLEIELTQKKIECETLYKEIEKEKTRNRELESDLQTSAAENTQLTVQVSDLTHRLLELEKVNEECNVLRLNLTEAQHECEVAKSERFTLQTKVENLNSVVKNLQESADKLDQVENEYKSTVQKLQEKQSHIDNLQRVQENAKEEYELALKSLQDRVIELQQRCHSQENRHRDLTKELETLRALATTNNNKKSRSPDHTKKSQSHPEHLSKQSHPFKGEVTENFHKQQSSSLNESSKLSNSNDSDHVVSTKSLDTGFADDDDVELDHSNEPSPDQPQVKGQANFEDPELSEISKKLKELEATDSEEDITPNYEDKGDDSGMESNREQKTKKENVITEEPGLSAQTKKGPIQVFVARYSYDPYHHSPNENPDAELPINAGDYVLVYGDMDEDGFFEAELIDGRRGLVPSNFVDKVADEDLAEFHAAVAGANHHDDDSAAANSIQQDLDFDSSEETEKPESLIKVKKKKFEKELSPGDSDDLDLTDSSHGYPNLDLAVSSHGVMSRISATGDQNVIPYPRNLTLDRQLSTSIVISWKPPENVDNLEIKSYHVYIDGEFKTSIRGNDRTKALVEDVDSKKVHRVSVRCVTSQGQSLDHHCTLLFGKDAVPAPSHLSVTDITSNSASVSWLPGNSNYQHALSVDGQEVRLVKPGICKYTLTGLVPNSDHTVTVTGRSMSSSRTGDELSASCQFRTLAGGLPDPPLNVQVEAGPQEGTLLLTWLPVTIDPSGFSNGAMVTGYMVYADGRKTKEAKGATTDYIVLRCDDFRGFIPKQLMVRTLTSDNKESIDSESVKLPQSLIKEITADAAKTSATEVLRKSTELKQKSPVPKELPDTDDEIERAFQEVAREAEAAMSPECLDLPSEEELTETSSSSSELSDIPEVEEELVLVEESTNQNAVLNQHSPLLVNSSPTPTKAQDDRVSPRTKPSPKKVSHKSPVKMEAPTESQSPVRLKSPLRVVPAIEITRDSSTERGTSLDASDEEMDISGRLSGRSSQGKSSDRYQNESPRSKSQSPRMIDMKSDKDNRGTSPQTSKYVQDMDSRDGYREANQNVDKFNEHQNKNTMESPKKHKKDKDLSKQSHKNDEKTSDVNLNSKSDKSSRTSPRTITNSPKHKKGKYYNERDSNANDLKSSDSYNEHKSDMNISEIEPVDYEDTGDVDSISGEINPPVEDNRVRLFVALFDYDPVTMSPNEDAIDEELPFKEGQILKIFGDKDADGFYRGECQGRMGFVPCNMVSEVQVDDPELAEQLLKESQETYNVESNQPVTVNNDHYLKPVENHTNVRLSPNGIPPMPGSGQSKRMVSLYDYDPQELSPNVDAELELAFRTGDIIIVHGEMDEDGFFMGELPNGQKGLVPSNFLTEAPLSDDDVLESASVVSPARSGESLNNLSASRQSDLGIDKIQKLGPSPQMESLQHDRVDVTPSHVNQHQVSVMPKSVSPDESKQKKKSSGILSKGKNIFKKFTR